MFNRQQARRRTLINVIFIGAAAASWLVPITLVSSTIHNRIYVLLVALAMCATTTSVLGGLLSRAQQRRDERQESEARWHQEQREYLHREVARTHDDMRRLIVSNEVAHDRAAGAILRVLREVSGKVARDEFATYSEVLFDLAGGKEAVGGETTRPLYPEARTNGAPIAPVVPLSRQNRHHN